MTKPKRKFNVLDALKENDYLASYGDNPKTLAALKKPTGPNVPCADALMGIFGMKRVDENPKKKKRAFKQHIPGQMNENENTYTHRLTKLIGEGIVEEFSFESETIPLAERCTLTPDFIGVLTDGTRFMVDVKGFWRPEDARIKFKWASTVKSDVLFVWAVQKGKGKGYREEAWLAGKRIKGWKWMKEGEVE